MEEALSISLALIEPVSLQRSGKIQAIAGITIVIGASAVL